MRLAGRAPDLLVLSFLGPLRRVPVPVMPVTGREDPRLFAGLDVILAHDGQRSDAVSEFAWRLYAADVRNLEAWNVFDDLWTGIVCGGTKYVHRAVPAIDRYGEVL